MLIVSQDIQAARRYGGDGRFQDQSYLVCRLTPQVLTAVTLSMGSTTTPNAISTSTLNASQLNNVLLPTPNSLPYGGDVNNLLEEACLLNTSLAAALSNNSDAVLMMALLDWHLLDAGRSG